jgi:hypothetical protein
MFLNCQKFVHFSHKRGQPLLVLFDTDLFAEPIHLLFLLRCAPWLLLWESKEIVQPSANFGYYKQTSPAKINWIAKYTQALTVSTSGKPCSTFVRVTGG